MNQKLNLSTEQFKTNCKRLIETISDYKKVIEYFESQEEEAIIFKDKVTTLLNEDIQSFIKHLEEQTFILVDNLFIVNPESEKYYKIKPFNSSNSNPAEGESQKP